MSAFQNRANLQLSKGDPKIRSKENKEKENIKKKKKSKEIIKLPLVYKIVFPSYSLCKITAYSTIFGAHKNNL